MTAFEKEIQIVINDYLSVLKFNFVGNLLFLALYRYVSGDRTVSYWCGLLFNRFWYVDVLRGIFELKATGLFKYVWPLREHQALEGYSFD